MRLPSGEFVWGLGDNSSTNNTVRDFKAFARRMYKSYMGDLADTNLFDQQMVDRVSMMQDKLEASNRFQNPHTRGVLDLETEYASGYKMRVPPGPLCIFFSITGAGGVWDAGYPYDIGESIQPGVPVDRRFYYHQPIGYNTNPFPMNTGVQDGISEFIRQLDMPRPNFGGRNCTTIPWSYNFYSMGALVGMAVVDRVLHGDLGRFKATYLGGSTEGNPRRQENHTFPGCLNSDSMGISQPNDHDMPDEHWDFAASKDMPGAGGDDLYTKVGGPGEDAAAQKNQRAVWDIVNKGNPLSLFAAVGMLMLNPSFTGGWDAGVAAFKALNFFVVQGITPHTRYQFTLPIANDPRNCWELAREHAVDLLTRRQPVYPQG